MSGLLSENFEEWQVVVCCLIMLTAFPCCAIVSAVVCDASTHWGYFFIWGDPVHVRVE